MQWWRAVADNGQLDNEQIPYMEKAGIETENIDGGVAVKSFSTAQMNWGVREDQLAAI